MTALAGPLLALLAGTALVAGGTAPAASGTAPAADASRTLDDGLAARPAGAARATWAAGVLRGAPYADSPLGEGEGRDPDPRFRLDRFDCQTLVETAIALGGATRVEEARTLLDDVRYLGPPSWSRRAHSVEAQWLPSLAAKGWAEEATLRLAGARARQEPLVLTRERWRKARAAGRTLPGLSLDDLPVGEFPVAWVPLADVAAVASGIPAGTIVLVVREARPDRPFRVTHMGILTEEGGRKVVRHASPLRRRVVDEPLDAFVARLGRERSWKVAGLGLWTIRDDGARAREVLAAPR